MYKPTIVFTMVLPAPNGCNLKCPFCAIAQRGEATNAVMTDADYHTFLDDVCKHFEVDRLSIQGYEPLLPEVWALTKSLLEHADTFDLETRLVTNGTTLTKYAEELSGLVDLVAISLDSSDPAIHDQLRGVPGCFEEAIAGIKSAVHHFGRDGVVVNSVLFPGKERYLEGMPKLLQGLGVGEWTVGPYKDMRIGGHTGGKNQMKAALLRMSLLGAKYGLKASLADEFRKLDTGDFYKGLLVAALPPNVSVIRLSPDATCSQDFEILSPSGLAPTWDRKEAPHIFLQRRLSE